jgi:hypothetical protein
LRSRGEFSDLQYCPFYWTIGHDVNTQVVQAFEIQRTTNFLS